ncbi:hypothetical protein CIK84_09680 [Glutamicibacter arilaitensis]|uniref:Helicase n=2 Tax=Glutamicibacter arilaitensis TaxID=256701 RepID=A0A2N7S6K5_9MICC|nr:hypothetical protein CIK84_09680 [Glutamicibacter arilaitensis]
MMDQGPGDDSMEFGIRQVAVGGLERAELMQYLAQSGVQLNGFAKQLLEHQIFDELVPAHNLTLTSRNLQQLGLDAGATLPQIFERAVSVGLKLCPAYAGPYLRLDFLDQAAFDDSVLSAGKKPAGSLTIASASVGDEDFPRGFYLRVVDEVAWLRGYRCDDTYGFALADTFVFRCR